jgi:putative spermidine/putrescine transport system substrate-binding protein
LKPRPTSPKPISAAIHPAKIELRVLGATVTPQEHIRKQAEKDLGIKRASPKPRN